MTMVWNRLTGAGVFDISIACIHVALLNDRQFRADCIGGGRAVAGITQDILRFLLIGLCTLTITCGGAHVFLVFNIAGFCTCF